MGLMADLGGGPVGVDTAIFIYFIEEHLRFLPLVEPLFREVNEGRKELVTSALTLLEVLVVPYRSGDHLLAEARLQIPGLSRLANHQPLVFRSRLRILSCPF